MSVRPMASNVCGYHLAPSDTYFYLYVNLMFVHDRSKKVFLSASGTFKIGFIMASFLISLESS